MVSRTLATKGLDGFLAAAKRVYDIFDEPFGNEIAIRGKSIAIRRRLIDHNVVALNKQFIIGGKHVASEDIEFDKDGKAIAIKRKLITPGNPKLGIDGKPVPDAYRDPAPRDVEHAMDDYIEKLWDASYSVDPTYFGALYLWCSVWYKENGNGNGYHNEPFEPSRDHHYLSSWLIGWRDLWYISVFCQLLSMLPTILSSFLGSALA